MDTPWDTEETVQKRMTRLLDEAHAYAQNGDLGSAAMSASAALETWQEAGQPDQEEEGA